jgi:hypothetical protein
MPTSVTTAVSVPGYRGRYSDFSSSTAEILYRHCHASYAKRVEEAFAAAELEDGEARPAQAAITGIVRLIDRVSRTESLSQPQVSIFYGEANVTWRCGKREVTLLSRGQADDPKLMYYENRGNQPSYHEMHPRADEKALLEAIGYSKKRRGWLYE